MKKMTLARQHAVVTGASSGIGKATALALGAAGASVVVNYVAHEDAALNVVSRIQRTGGRAQAIRADVSDESQVQELFRRAHAQFGPLHILVNNAGLQADAPFLDMTLAQWQQVIDVNLTGQFLCAREAVRAFMRTTPDTNISAARGKIVCISSVHQTIPWAGHANYAASKGGVMLLMQSLAQELAPSQIRVNAVAPGAIKTAINRQAWATPEREARLLKLIPYRRIGVPDDVAKAVVWLASDESDYATGTTLVVDGGMTLYPSFREAG